MVYLHNILTTHISTVQGYNLVPPGVRPQADTERTLSPLLLDIVRWFVHAAYFLSETAAQHQQRVFKVTTDLNIFLTDNMNRDLDGK